MSKFNVNKKVLAIAVAGALSVSNIAQAGYYEIALNHKDQAVAEQMANKMINTYSKATTAHAKAIATYTRLGRTNKIAYHEKQLAKYSAELERYENLLLIIRTENVNTITEAESVTTVEDNNNDEQTKYETTAKNNTENQTAVSGQNTDTTEKNTEAVNEVTAQTVTGTSTTQVETTTTVTEQKEQEVTVEENPTTIQATEEKTVAEQETNTIVVESEQTDETLTPALSFQTQEFSSATSLGTINADVAYSRGYTGKGSTVVVIDSGANVNHIDLDNNIVGTKNFINGSTDVTDNLGHGTHVAGIIAAEKNDTGMHGVAYNAKLLIAKVSDNWASGGNKRQIDAIKWGRENGAVVANISSATTRFDKNWENSLVKIEDGSYYSNHYYYSVNGYSGVKNQAQAFKDALGDDMVLVRAAGNGNLDYAAGTNQIATATDDNGNLILDGQVLIVGNWTGKFVRGVKAGNVCTTYVNGKCKDAAKVSDFYILAPGYWNSTYDNDYRTMSGTSMAAPAVSGAIAILHEMWPHMKGKHLVELVLRTANKDLPDYQEHVHGQGLLDLDAATQPQGATGIPTTGRTDGGITQLTGVVAGSTAGAEELASVMVLDGYERDYYVDLSNAVFVDTRTTSVASNTGIVNFFNGYGRTDQRLSTVYQITDTFSVQPGFTHEEGTYLGNTQSGVYGNLESSTTTYANFNYNKQIEDVTLFGQFGVGLTNANFDTTNTMLVNADNIISTTWTLGAEYEGFGTALSQPIMIESANMTYDVPTARTLDGAVITERKTVNFKGERELDFSVYYKYNVNNIEIKTYAEQRMGPIDEVNAGISAAFKF
jgi:subtilisin family serine protease